MNIKGEMCGFVIDDILNITKRGVEIGEIENSCPCEVCNTEDCPCRDSENPHVPLECYQFKANVSLIQNILSY